MRLVGYLKRNVASYFVYTLIATICVRLLVLLLSVVDQCTDYRSYKNELVIIRDLLQFKS